MYYNKIFWILIGSLSYQIALKFDMCLSSSAAEAPVIFQSNETTPNVNLRTSRFSKIFRQDSLCNIETLLSCIHFLWL